MRALSFCLLFVTACSVPPERVPVEASTYPVLADSSRLTPEVAELLREGEIRIDRPPPAYPDSALVDSLREVMSNRVSIFPTPEVDAFGVDSLGREVPVTTVLRETAKYIDEDMRAFVRFLVAWDGTVTRAEVVRVYGEVPAAPVRIAVAHIRFTPPRDADIDAVLPEGVPSFAWAYYSIPFSRSWLNE